MAAHFYSFAIGPGKGRSLAALRFFRSTDDAQFPSELFHRISNLPHVKLQMDQYPIDWNDAMGESLNPGAMPLTAKDIIVESGEGQNRRREHWVLLIYTTMLPVACIYLEHNAVPSLSDKRDVLLLQELNDQRLFDVVIMDEGRRIVGKRSCIYFYLYLTGNARLCFRAAEEPWHNGGLSSSVDRVLKILEAAFSCSMTPTVGTASMELKASDIRVFMNDCAKQLESASDCHLIEGLLASLEMG
jgi:hypothetical protein